MAERDLPPVPLNTPITDASGRVSQTWAAWLRQLFFRVGGHQALTNIELEAGSVDSVGTDQIQDGAVTNPKLAAGAVSTSKLEDGSVTEPKLATDAVTTEKIQDASITLLKMASNSVGNSQLADESISTGKLLDQAVTIEKLSPEEGSEGQMPRIVGSNVTWVDPPSSTAVGGQLVTDGEGANEINISPTASTLVLQDSGAVKWDVTVTNGGILTTASGSVGTPNTAFKILKPDASYGQIGINTDGTLYVQDVPTATAVDNSFYLQSADLGLWELAIDNSNRIQTVEDVGDGCRLSLVNNQGDVLWQQRSVAGYLMLQYLQVLTTTDLAVATPPPTVTGLLPLALLNNGSAKRLVFYDGAAWRYVHDNSAAP